MIRHLFIFIIVFFNSFEVIISTCTQLYSEERLLNLSNSSSCLFDENYNPSPKLLELLEGVGMKPLNQSEKAIIQINRWAQINLLRQGERWEKQTNRFEELKPQLISLLINLGFVDATLPLFKNYQGAIVHGALVSTVRLRLHYLIEQWEQGIRFSKLYFLSGERYLEEHEYIAIGEDHESPLKIRKDWKVPIKLPKTECEMIQLIWEQSVVPEDMRQKVEVYFINAPMKKDSKIKKNVRPTTDDTVIAWLNESPPQGCYLAISNAPHTARQDLVIRNIAPSQYQFDTIGPCAKESEKMVIFLDEVARMIFEIKQLSEK